jgi:hypothetical protein
MKHLLMNPAFPDLVGQWAAEIERAETERTDGANDNDEDEDSGVGDPLLIALARQEIAATRLW